MAVFRAEIQIEPQLLPVVKPLLASHCLLDVPVERNPYITGNLEHEWTLLSHNANRACQASFHVSAKDSLISRLTLESAPTQIAVPNECQKPFPANIPITNESEENMMHAVIRTYSGKGAKELVDLLEQRTADVQSLMRSVKGFISYTFARSASGGFSVTVCQDKAGIDESVQKAKEWIAKNAGNTGVGAPQVSEGTVIMHVK